MVISESLKGYMYEVNMMEKNVWDGVRKLKYLCYKNSDQAENS